MREYMKLGCEKPKGCSVMYETYELAWSSYQRNGEQKQCNQSNQEPPQALFTKFETSRAENGARKSESWSDDEVDSAT